MVWHISKDENALYVYVTVVIRNEENYKIFKNAFMHVIVYSIVYNIT